MGFQRGVGGFEFRALTAWGKKLLSSLAERALMVLWSAALQFPYHTVMQLVSTLSVVPL